MDYGNISQRRDTLKNILKQDDKVSLYEPELEDYWYEAKLLSDSVTMNYNAGYNVSFEGYHYDTGCIDFPKEKWKNDYERRKSKNVYFAYIKNNNQFVGYVNYHFNLNEKRYDCGIVIEANKRGHGFSKVGLALLCEKAKENGITELYDEFELDRKDTLKLFESLGFEVIEYTTIVKFNTEVTCVLVKKVL